MLDNSPQTCYNTITMKNVIKVPNEIAREADNLAKETHLPFRDCLDILMRAYLAPRDRVVCTWRTKEVVVDR